MEVRLPRVANIAICFFVVAHLATFARPLLACCDGLAGGCCCAMDEAAEATALSRACCCALEENDPSAPSPVLPAEARAASTDAPIPRPLPSLASVASELHVSHVATHDAGPPHAPLFLRVRTLLI